MLASFIVHRGLLTSIAIFCLLGALPAARATDRFSTSFEPGQIDPDAADSSTITIAVRTGPQAPYAAKPNAGYSAAHALRYASNGAGGRRALFTTDLLIQTQTTLSWMVLPESVGNDHVASTYVSLDLLLDDGTHVSASAARDQHGVALGAQAQGDSKTLYPQQWARKQVRLGDVPGLRGRRVRAIELDVAPPAGARAAGWIDDIAIAEC